MVLPGMADGRIFTSYVSSCVSETNLKNTFNLNTNNEYTEHLRKKSNVLLENVDKVYNERVKKEQWWK